MAAAAGSSRESDEEYAQRLQQQEDELARQRQSELENDEAIARQLAALDADSASAPATDAPAADRTATDGDEDLARSLQEEEKRASQVAPPIAHAYPALDPSRAHPTVVQAYKLVSDVEAIVSNIGVWFESRIQEALLAGQCAAPAAATLYLTASAAPDASPAADPPANGLSSPPRGQPASNIYGQSHAEYVVPEVDDEQDANSPAPDLSSGPRVLKSRPEVELVAFGDEAAGAAADAVRMDSALEELILGRLCGVLHAMLSDGLTQPILGGLFQGGARSAWTLLEAWASAIEARCESTMGERERAKPSVCLIGLLKAIRRISQLYDEQLAPRGPVPPAHEFKFRALVCYGLNVGELHEWFAMLALDGPAERIFEWYDSGAFLTMREAVLVAAEKLVPLASQQFRLPLQIECKAITREGGTYCFAAQQEAHAWL